MKMNYYLDKKKYEIEFCPDREGTDIKKKKTILYIDCKRFKKRSPRAKSHDSY